MRKEKNRETEKKSVETLEKIQQIPFFFLSFLARECTRNTTTHGSPN